MIDKNMIAPCGMNCVLCLAYQRQKNRCFGCNNYNTNNELDHIKKCIIKNCDTRNTVKHCYNCNTYPCKRLKQLDKRYKTKYNMSMIDNLNYIKEKGQKEFLVSEEKRWTCGKCGSLICVHRSKCLKCDK